MVDQPVNATALRVTWVHPLGKWSIYGACSGVDIYCISMMHVSAQNENKYINSSCFLMFFLYLWEAWVHLHCTQYVWILYDSLIDLVILLSLTPSQQQWLPLAPANLDWHSSSTSKPLMQNKPSCSVGEETTCLNLSKSCTVAPLSNSISALKSPSKKTVELGRKAKLSSSHSSHSPQQTHSEHMQNIWYTKCFLDALSPNMSIPKQQNTFVPGSQSDFCLCHVSTEKKRSIICLPESAICCVFLSVFRHSANGEHSKLESRIAKAAMILKGTMNHSLQSLAIETSQQPRFAKADAWDHDVSMILVDKAYPKIEWILDQSLNLGF